MAIFKQTAEDMKRMDYRILRDSPVALYFNRVDYENVCAWFRLHSYQMYHFDCTEWIANNDRNRQPLDIYDTLYEVMGLPMANNGYNLDALRDDFMEMKVSQEGGAVIELFRFDVIVNHMPQFAWHFLDIIAEVSRINLLFGQRLLALIYSDDSTVSIEPVGACPVIPSIWLPK